ncbi:MAG: leucine-rich repeat protein [Lentisphaeria bacterium]|nr:leucine-rich repeat protein [Lentisphaeria bacterium]
MNKTTKSRYGIIVFLCFLFSSFWIQAKTFTTNFGNSKGIQLVDINESASSLNVFYYKFTAYEDGLYRFYFTNSSAYVKATVCLQSSTGKILKQYLRNPKDPSSVELDPSYSGNLSFMCNKYEEYSFVITTTTKTTTSNFIFDAEILPVPYLQTSFSSFKNGQAGEGSLEIISNCEYDPPFVNSGSSWFDLLAPSVPVWPIDKLLNKNMLTAMDDGYYTVYDFKTRYKSNFSGYYRSAEIGVRHRANNLPDLGTVDYFYTGNQPYMETNLDLIECRSETFSEYYKYRRPFTCKITPTKQNDIVNFYQYKGKRKNIEWEIFVPSMGKDIFYELEINSETEWEIEKVNNTQWLDLLTTHGDKNAHYIQFFVGEPATTYETQQEKLKFVGWGPEEVTIIINLVDLNFQPKLQLSTEPFDGTFGSPYNIFTPGALDLLPTQKGKSSYTLTNSAQNITFPVLTNFLSDDNTWYWTVSSKSDWITIEDFASIVFVPGYVRLNFSENTSTEDRTGLIVLELIDTMPVSSINKFHFISYCYITQKGTGNIAQYTITAQAGTGGTVTGGGTYAAGATCTLTATPNNGYSFSHWSVNGTQVSINHTYSFTVNESKTVKAVFSKNAANYTITAQAGTGGTVTGGGTYAAGATCTLTATPTNGYSFSHWSVNGTQVNTSRTYSFTVNENKTVTANFTKNVVNYTITAQAGTGGTVTGSGTYATGATCTLTATANNGYSFSHWSVNGIQVSITRTYSFTVNENRTVTAIFTKNVVNYTITAQAGTGGCVTGGGTFAAGTTCTLTAIPDDGYSFSHWKEDNLQASTSSNYTFTVTQNRTLTAEFIKDAIIYTVTTRVNNGGTVTGGGQYKEGEICTLIATPKDGYTFNHWAIEDRQVSTDSTYQFTVESSQIVVATFMKLSSCNLYIDSTKIGGCIELHTDGVNGIWKITGNGPGTWTEYQYSYFPSNISIKSGNKLTLSVYSLLPGCSFSHWLINNELQIKSEEYSTIIYDDMSIEPVFKVEYAPESDFKYEINDNQVSIIKYLGNKNFVYIPAYINNFPVTEIKKWAFSQYNGKYIIFPDTLRLIRTFAFYSCGNLEYIRFPLIMDTIEADAFNNCYSLKNIILTASNCKDRFYGCDKLTQIELARTVDYFCFQGLPPSVSYIYVEEENPKYSYHVVESGCSVLEYKPTNELLWCSSKITRIALSWDEYYYWVFSNCNMLEKIYLQDYEGTLAILPRNSLNWISAWDSNKKYYSQEGVLYDNTRNTLLIYPCKNSRESYETIGKIIGDEAFRDSNNLMSVTIGKETEKIGDGAFINCAILKNIAIPDSTKEFGYSCFYKCESLETLKIPTGVEILPYNMFGYCEKLDNIIIPDTCKTIGERCFYGCKSLKELYIPKSVTFIGGDAFAECPELSSITFLGDYPQMNQKVFSETNNINVFAYYNDTWKGITNIDGHQVMYYYSIYINGKRIEKYYRKGEKVKLVVDSPQDQLYLEKWTSINGIKLTENQQNSKILEFYMPDTNVELLATFKEPIIQNYELREGWNLISITLQLTNESQDYLKKYNYFCLDTLNYSYVKKQNVELGEAIWIYTKQAMQLRLSGYDLNDSNFIETDGWSLIGIIKDAIPANNITIWEWSGHDYKLFKGDMLRKGKAYLIYK